MHVTSIKNTVVISSLKKNIVCIHVTVINQWKWFTIVTYLKWHVTQLFSLGDLLYAISIYYVTMKDSWEIIKQAYFVLGLFM